MTQSGTKWSDMEIQQLRELAGKHSATYIATQIGRSPDGVSKQIKNLGLPGYVQYPKKEPIPDAQRRSKAPVGGRAYVEPPAGLRQPAKAKAAVSYPAAELCPVHHCLVSDWSGHVMRLGNTCSRPTA